VVNDPFKALSHPIRRGIVERLAEGPATVGEATAGFGVAQADYGGMRGVAERSAFLIDGDGTVRGAWRYETGEVPDVDELLSAARALPP
jgi:peroxiredoxin